MPLDRPGRRDERGASIADLKSEDKEKINNLLRELVRARKHGEQASMERTEYQQRLLNLRSQNSEIIQVWTTVLHSPPNPA